MLLRHYFSWAENLSSLFHRPGNNYAFIDGLRAMAILMIILYHSFYTVKLGVPPATFKQFVQQTPAYLAWVWNLEKSLEIFFVISGFLIANLLFKEFRRENDISLRRFYWRRYLRLTPLYLVAIFIYWLSMGDKAKNLWANVFYVNNFLPLDEVSMPWTWSLAVEEQFYLIFPLLLLTGVFRRDWGLWVLMALLAASFVINYFVLRADTILWNNAYSDILIDPAMFKHFFSNYYDDLHTRFGGFVCGIIVAYLHTYRRNVTVTILKRKVFSQGITWLALIYLVVAFNSDVYVQDSMAQSHFHFIASRNVFSMALAWILLVCLYPVDGVGAWIKRCLSARFWYPIAQLSYSMYLFHYTFIMLIALNLYFNVLHLGFIAPGALVPHHWLLAIFFLGLMASMLWGMVTYLLVERPFMRMRDMPSKSTPMLVN